MQNVNQIENKVLDEVRKASHLPLQQVQVVVGGDKEAVGQAIRSLIDTGKLQLTLDWELREKK
jgi:hypothetical protein